MANLKTGVSRKQSTPKFPKNKHFVPTDSHTYAFEMLFRDVLKGKEWQNTFNSQRFIYISQLNQLT